MDDKYVLFNSECIETMKCLPDGSVDMILCDPPYGTTACKWDTVIPFDAMWEQLKRVIKPNGCIALFGSEPFSSALRMSNIKEFKYDWIWLKDKPSGFLNSKKMPMGAHEIISIFYSKPPSYTPQYWESKPMNTVYFGGADSTGKSTENYGKHVRVKNEDLNKTKRFPLSYLKMNTVNGQSKDKTAHPTQKPVPLLEYLIKTYTLENEVVLDFTMGSGSTGVAALNLNRRFIGIELEQKYFEIAEKRIAEAATNAQIKKEPA